MKLLQAILVVVMILANLAFAQPSFADQPKFLKNPDYVEVNKALNNLVDLKKTQAQTENPNTEEIQNKINELEFQKYALETGVNWGQCRNETGKTLAVYGPKPKFDDDDDSYNYPYDNAIYFLADGQTTKNKWDCDGVYLPNDVKIAGIKLENQSQELSDPVAVKIADGTQLVVKKNPNTGNIEFNIPPTKVFKTGELNWFIPKIAQAVIDTRVPNAPVAKINGNQLIGMRNLEKDRVESKITPETQPQTEPQTQAESQSQPQSQPVSPAQRRLLPLTMKR